MMEVNGNYIFTLRDAMSLAKNADKSPIGKTMYDSAIQGNYVLTPEQAAAEATRTGHLKDAGAGLALTGLPSGKTVDHITFSSESPYAINGLKAAQGGQWDELPQNKWSYTPSQQTVDKHGTKGLADYFSQYEKSNKLILK